MYPKIRFGDLIPGNLCSFKNHGATFWRLTWKEKQKTKTRYIRLDEVDDVRRGVEAYAEAKAALERVARANLQRMLDKRRSR